MLLCNFLVLPICPICTSVPTCLILRLNLLGTKIGVKRGIIQKNCPSDKSSPDHIHRSLQKLGLLEITAKRLGWKSGVKEREERGTKSQSYCRFVLLSHSLSSICGVDDSEVPNVIFIISKSAQISRRSAL